MQGARIFGNEAYLKYVGMTKDEVQRRRWAFYEAVSLFDADFSNLLQIRLTQ